jgi:hypothetical protein
VDALATTASGLSVLATDTDPPVVPDTPVSPNLLETLEII